MRRLICITLLLFSLALSAQEEEPANDAGYPPYQGLTFNLNEGDYQFIISGFIQPSASFDKIGDNDTEYQLNAKRAFFMVGGKAAKEKVSFLLQANFSSADPLFDAWIAYDPLSWLTVSAGQKQNFVNNREMIYREDRLQFTDRSLNSQTFSNTGREFGLFVETTLEVGNDVILAPKASVTSGDGRNSFGADSRDVDLGGVKYGGRLDVYPLGSFSNENDLYTVDLAHEESPKLLLGVAASKNNGASHPSGEGHGEFLFYDTEGIVTLPDYNQLYTDLLVKYMGMSLLLEYTNATVLGIDEIYTDEAATTILAPTQISEFLVLGEGFTGQVGYVTKSGFSFDLRYEKANPEFSINDNSLLREFDSYTFGFTKYFNGNNIKLQTAITSTNYGTGDQLTSGEFLFQIRF